MRALITNKNNPSVTMVAGKVRKMSTGLMNALINESTRAAITAFQLLATSTPGNSHPRNKMTTADMSMRATMIFMLFGLIEQSMQEDIYYPSLQQIFVMQG
jgi:hypothetical protein